MHPYFWHAVLRRPRFFLTLSASGRKQGGRRYFTTCVGIPAFKVAELAF